MDAVPNGFPRTESGVELRLLAKMFTPEGARLASSIGLTPEPVAAISARANLNQETALDLLNAMATKRVIRLAHADGEGILRDGPPVHCILRVDAATPFEVEIFPFESNAPAPCWRAPSHGVYATASAGSRSA